VKGKRILVIDDDPDLVALLQVAFEKEGAEVFGAANGRAGIREFGACQPDLVVLDVMMPGLDGWETCRLLRRVSDVPIIFLTVLSRDEQIVRGLDCGAVDYVTKPFSLKILRARARVALRVPASAPERRGTTTFDDGYLVVDVEKRRVQVGGEPARLTATEYRLLAYLVENAGQILTYGQILERVWGWEYREAVSYVHVYVSRLRHKIEWDASHPTYILTEHGVGYSFAARSPGPQGKAVAESGRSR
jgi:two-component system KDP operon response regulator KdpE